MRYLKKILFLIIILLTLRISLPYFDLYSYKITENYVLVGKCCDNYVLKKGFFGKTLVSKMNRRSDWIIGTKEIYGNKGNNNYFFIDKQDDSVFDFNSLSELNIFLEKRNINKYNMSKSENLSHLKFNNERERKYK